MRRIATSLVLLAGIFAAQDAAAQTAFSYRGLTLGMNATEFTSALTANGWGIPSYTVADGRSLARALEYKGMPMLDSLTDEVLVETPGAKLDCPTPGASTCVDVVSIKARFVFGHLRSLELISGNGQEKLFRPYAHSGLRELERQLGPGDRTPADIDRFFETYAIDRAKTFAEVPVATWKGNNVSARIFVVRLTEKYDYFREESGVFTPWGACKVAITQDDEETMKKWEAMKAELKSSHASR